MPKLRNAETELGAFTQWIGRKCRNHNPLKELGMSKADRSVLGDQYKTKKRGDVTIHGEQENTLLYEAGGRVFKIQVGEITDRAELEKTQTERRVPVGY